MGGNVTEMTNSTSGQPAPFLPWDNPHNVIDFATFQDIEFVLNCVLDPALWMLGVGTNTINLAVFYRQGLKDRMNLCLFSLAMIDALYLTTNLLQTAHRFVTTGTPGSVSKASAYLLNFCVGPNLALLLTSGSMTMIVAIERCICVVFPLKAARLISTRTMAVVIIGVAVLLQIMGAFLVSGKFKVTKLVDLKTGTARYVMTASDFNLENRQVLDVLTFIFTTPVLPIGTFIVVSLCTIITVVQLRLALAWRASTSGGDPGSEGGKKLSQQQAALTKMLVLVSCLYIVCSVPSVAMAMTRFAVPDDGFKTWGRYSNIFLVFNDVSYTIAAVNSSFNFFIYMWRSSRFKQTLAAMLPCTGMAVKGPPEQFTQASVLSSE